MEFYSFAVEKEDIGTRIDIFLAANIDDLTRNGIQKLIESGNVTINDKAVKANYKLRSNDIINISVPDPVSVEILSENIPLDILYEDDDIIIINKPQGMVVHPAPGHYSGTLVNALMYHCGDGLSGINGVLRPGIVHRIDKDTSGVLMIAKNNHAHQGLAEQLAEHSITRKYNAIVFDNIKDECGTINKPIGRSILDRKKMTVTEKNSRNAVTYYRVLERFGKYTFIEAQLETGRTHQIRVHMAYIGHPLLGDTVYTSRKQPFNLNGQVLHARVLGFNHPKTGEYMEFESKLPEYFEKLLNRLRKQNS